MIEESEHKDNYAVNSKYLCSLLFRGILNPEIYKKFLEKAQKDN
jgi:hypothetical protein